MRIASSEDAKRRLMCRILLYRQPQLREGVIKPAEKEISRAYDGEQRAKCGREG